MYASEITNHNIEIIGKLVCNSRKDVAAAIASQKNFILSPKITCLLLEDGVSVLVQHIIGYELN